MSDINKDVSETEKYIREHIHAVQKRMYIVINELMRRCEIHDHTKLEEGELAGWESMDSEPRYNYGSKEYFEKVDRYKWLLDRHYQHHDNKHHPEHFGEWWPMEMDLVDLIEMVCDWCAYKDEISADDAFDTIEQQIKRFDVPEVIRDIMINTMMRYFVDRPADKKVYDVNPLVKEKLTVKAAEPEVYDDRYLEELYGEDEEPPPKTPKTPEMKMLNNWLEKRLKDSGLSAEDIKRF